MKTVHFFFLSLILVLVAAELFLTPFIKLPKPNLENNSFIYSKRQLPPVVGEETYVFIGSSAFSRDIDCDLFPKTCLNLSMDGADARIYDVLIRDYLYPMKAKKVVIELSSMVFVSDYDTLGAMDTFLYSPDYFLKNFVSHGLSNKFKQSIKNQIDSYFFWSRLNFLSRRERLASWPTFLYSLIFNKSDIPHTEKAEVFVNTYLSPDLERVELFKKLIIELRQKDIEVHVVSEPIEYQGVIDPEIVLNSPLILELKKLAADHQVKFHERFKTWGLKDEMLDELQHYLPQFIPWHTQTIMKMVQGSSK